ncbi:MAG: lipoyl synthase [Chloroflexi bacterium]|nr:MAG: lipoyl synthase [Chloroflexota bacterium]TMB97368.1 MAG: lipoyl synthase [Chloroflexota bacterium]TMC29877.1 MAG: lipoyl synthase [Chloroflexota bacterium]TMC34094.1 MAG: lipoyl synthase [Chloroflexota bacterium]TMC58651.1 MAG: lipoyl synthase [Chloroflexota bacterium]
MPGEVERPRSRGRGVANTVVPIDRARPDWLKVRLPTGPTYENLRRLMRSKELHTVCEEAHCPNMAECWGAGTATFMILGETCTRSCGFCAVKTGRPGVVDSDEPARVGDAVARMSLGHAVVTSVNRDELPDGGASIFADTIREIRLQSPGTTVEVLIPDFLGKPEALDAVIDAKPEVLSHNVETVARLYSRVRPQARYERSLGVLRRIAERAPEIVCKTGIMLGLGETKDEVVATMRDIVAEGAHVLTIGQYLRPSPMHLPIERYWTPDEFAELRDQGMALGFRHVESGPLVRSSYHAERHVGV